MSAASNERGVDALCERLLEQQPQSKVLLDRLLKRLDARSPYGAFAPIQDRRCCACHMTIAAVRLQRAKKGEFISCASCSRFLYIDAQ